MIQITLSDHYMCSRPTSACDRYFLQFAVTVGQRLSDSNAV